MAHHEALSPQTERCFDGDVQYGLKLRVAEFREALAPAPCRRARLAGDRQRGSGVVMNVPATERLFSMSSKARLSERDLGRFSGPTLFERLARAVCRAGCLPRKELYEAWETARRIRRRFRGGRIVDLAAGHGLLSHVLMILDNSSPLALVVDTTLPKSSATLHDVLVDAWPRLKDRFRFEERPLESVVLSESDLVVSGHACGGPADLVIDRASAARAR